MKKTASLLFATLLESGELEDLKGFVSGITEKIEKHYGFTVCVEFADVFCVTADMLQSYEWTYVIMSSKPSKKRAGALEAVFAKYRKGRGDALTTFVADGMVGKQVRRVMGRYRSLEPFTSMEALKLQLYYEFCAHTDIGGLTIVTVPHGGKVSICGEELETVNAADAAVYAGNAETAEAVSKNKEASESFEYLKGLYDEKKGDGEYAKVYGEAGRWRTLAAAELGARENVISEIMGTDALMRKAGMQSDDYRTAYAYFLRGDCAKAYETLAKSRELTIGSGPCDMLFNNVFSYLAAAEYLQMRLISLLPRPYTLPGRTKPLDTDKEWEKLLRRLQGNANGRDDFFLLTFFYLTHLASRWDGAYARTKWYRGDVKKELDALKKKKGDNRYAMYRLTMMLANYYIEAESTRAAKLYLDKSLSLIQDLSKDYNGLYDMYVGDTYITYCAHYRNRRMDEEMQDSLFAAADRYRSALSSGGQENNELYSRLGFTYRTLARNYARAGRMDQARDFLCKAADWFGRLSGEREKDGLQGIAEMYEEFAESVEPPEGNPDVGEAEDCLLAALAAYKELAVLKPYEFTVHPGLMYDKLGCLFRRAGEYDEGMDYFRSAEAEYRQDIAAFGEMYNPLLAKCYVSMFADPQSKDYEEATEKLMWAVDIFDKAAEKDPGFYTPESAGAWRMLARLQKAKGENENSIQSHIKAMSLFDACEDVTDNSVCYVSDLALELADIAELYDMDKAENEESAQHAEEFHLQAIGTAYCADAINLPDMGNTLKAVTSSYMLSLLDPGFNALIALLGKYVTNTLGEEAQDLAEKVADYSDTRPDISEEDDRVISQMLEAMGRSRAKAKDNPDAYMFLLGAYSALESQYYSMDNEKEAKKYGRKARKLFKDEFLPRDDEDYDDDYTGTGTLDDLSEAHLREVLGDDLYEELMKILSGASQGLDGPYDDFDEPEDDGYDYLDDDDEDDPDYDAIIEEILRDGKGGDIQEMDAPQADEEEQMESVEKFIRSLEKDPNPNPDPDGNMS